MQIHYETMRFFNFLLLLAAGIVAAPIASTTGPEDAILQPFQVGRRATPQQVENAIEPIHVDRRRSGPAVEAVIEDSPRILKRDDASL